ncbi:bifunctional glycosyltransferase family 2/GtrA family protein [Arachnia propionica]|uniref:bifunctional glycosyltransferase family 2/GtrA family protein n=1 Tax=Arachnia propionica TaxID=1750 RepID=UPI00163AAE56|nr:bifunctional glycosyltransferase family 2/GtrA family protein [Arachnia propionica]
MSVVLVLIPAFEPGDSLIRLVRDLRRHPRQPEILVIDDGSGPDFDEVFALSRLHGAEVLRHHGNRGKGHALKTGFAHARRAHPGEVVVCADSDGQHEVADIIKVADEVDPGAHEMVLGGRRFTGRVPLRSRIGNTTTTWLFQALTGIGIGDTQTGLRAYPPSLLEWLQSVPGERFEYELRLLLQARDAGVGIREVGIETIYLAGNAGSHFRPVIDSWRVYRPLLAFAGASLVGFVTDTLVLLAMMTLTGHLLLSVVTARVLSATLNYHLGRRVVFRAGDRSSVLRYGGLAAGLLVLNCLLIAALDAVMPLVVAKVLTELSLFAVSFVVQRAVVFTAEQPVEVAPAGSVGR